MTGRTNSNLTGRHALRVLEGGLAEGGRGQDEPADVFDRTRLAQEIEEAARLADRLADDGLRIAFEPRVGARGVRAVVRDGQGHDLRELDARDVTQPTNLIHLETQG